MVNDFFNEKEHEGKFEHIFGEYLSAREEGCVASLNLNEDEYEYLLDRLVEEGKDEEVLELSELAFAKFPYSVSILARFCDTLILLGNPDKALEILSLYVDSFSTESHIFILFARANISKKRFAHARDYFYKAMELSSEGKDIADSIMALGQDCIDAGNYREAIYYLDKASRIVELPYEFYNDYAFCYDKLDESLKSLDFYNRYLDANPFNDTVWFNVGTVQARLKDFDKAIEAFEYSIALNAENSSSLYNLAVVYMNLQRYKEAAETFERFIVIDPDILGKLGLGEAYIRLEMFDDALRQFESVMSVAEAADEAQCGINSVKAIIYCRNGDYDVFKELFLRILETGTAWLAVVYDMLPFLQGEEWFIEFLESIKK